MENVRVGINRLILCLVIGKVNPILLPCDERRRVVGVITRRYGDGSTVELDIASFLDDDVLRSNRVGDEASTRVPWVEGCDDSFRD